MPESSTPVGFFVCARDPSGESLRVPWSAAALPQIGDTLILPDGSSGQDVHVMERVFYAGGDVELWVGEFTNWQPGDVKAIFDRMTNG